MVRAKFRLTSMTANSSNGDRAMVFTPQYDPTIPEDVAFSKATPSGELKFYCTNPAANAQLELGKDYYLDLTPVPAPEAAPAT